MSSVDDRIVRMQFDNAQFKRGAQETKQSLADVDTAIGAAGKNKGLLSLSGNMQRVAVTASKMAIVTTTALATIANKAVNVGLQMANSLTLGPIRQGFAEYESLLTKQNVIMNATGKSADEVKAYLTELNEYSDKTIYSFGNMTDAIQKFVNAGVPLDTSVTTIKGIANAAAFAGASTEEANRAMYAFSQSMSLGFIQLQDWNQIENANLGTIKFKNELLEAGVAAGTLTRQGKGFITESGKFVSATKGWRDGLQEQWATTEVLNAALGKYADQNTKLGRQAFKSATEVRTFSAFMDTLKESLGSGWASIFTTLIGGLDESTKMWTNLSNSVGEVVHTFFEFTNTTISTFKELGGATKVLEGFKNIASPFVALFHAIGDAWQAAFPGGGKGAGQILYTIASGFELVTRPLTVLAGWIENATPLLTIFFQIIKMGAGGVEALAGYLSDLASSFGGLGSGLDSGGFTQFLTGIVEVLGKVAEAGLDFAGDFVRNILEGLGNASIGDVANVLSAGLLGVIALQIKKFLTGGFGLDLGNGFLEKVGDAFDSLTGSLENLQAALKAKTLMNIAIAVGILSASMVALSMIDGDKLGKALAATGAGMGQLLLGMVLLSKVGGAGAFITLPILAAGLAALATSMLIMTAAIAAMSALSWEQIAKGLAGVGGALVVIALGMKLMPKTLPITAAGLVLVSVGLLAISGAMAAMSLLSWEDIGKGLVTTAGALVIIAGAMRMMPKTLPVTAAGLVLVGVALTTIAGALKIMGSMSWEDIAQSLVALGGALVVLSVGLNSMMVALPGAAALAVAAVGIAVLVPALALLGTMSWEDIAQALVALGGGLAILAVALTSMVTALPGALALLVVTPALMGLTGVLVTLGALSWETIATGLAALAGVLAVIGVAGLLLGPVVPILIGLGAAIVLLGAGMALAGVGFLAFASGLTMLVALGGAAFGLLAALIMDFIEMLPDLAIGFANFIVAFAKAIADNTGPLMDSFVKMLTGLINAAERVLPKLPPLVSKMIRTFLQIVEDNVPTIVSKGAQIISSFLGGLAREIPKIARQAANLAIAFIRAIGKESPRIADAGAKAVIDTINGMAKAIDDNDEELGEAMGNLGVQMVEGLIVGIGSMAGEALSAIGNLAGDMVNAAKDKFKIFSPSRVFRDIGKFVVKGLTIGVQSEAATAVTAVATMVGGQIATATQYVDRFAQLMDQRAIAAQGKAEGLKRAAEAAEKSASRTKSTKDDRAADRLGSRADAAQRQADAAQRRADAAEKMAENRKAFAEADLFGKAKIKSQYAQDNIDRAKAAEERAARDVALANALDKQAKQAGSKKERKRLEAQEAAARKSARENAKDANRYMEVARTKASEALEYQKMAGEQAAREFEAAFKADAKADADAKRFDKMSDAEKAKERKRQAQELQKSADRDLAAAKKLAYTDLEGANKLAEQARSKADQARAYLDDVEKYTNDAAKAAGETPIASAAGTVVNLKSTDAAAVAMRDYEDIYASATAAAASGKSVEFNQYNQSPEALSPSEVYRQTNNLFNFAVEKIDEAA